MIHALKTLVSVLVLTTMSASLSAETILDTGPVSVNDSYTPLGSHFWLAHQFTVSEATTITTIEGFVVRRNLKNSTGELKAAIYSNGEDSLPDERLFEQTFFVPLPDAGDSDPRWHGAEDLSWIVSADTYWVALVVDEEDLFSGAMPLEREQDAISAGWTGPEDPPFPGEPPIPAQWEASTAKLGLSPGASKRATDGRFKQSQFD